MQGGNSELPVPGAQEWARINRWRLVAALAAASLAGYLLYRILRLYRLDQIVAAVTAIPPSRLMLAGGFAAGSYVCLTGFDWLGLRYARHPLSYRKAALASFIGLSLGHNIGFAALSSGAIRYRFYSRWGLDAEEVAKVIVFCGATVGLGLMILGGIGLLCSPRLADEFTGLGRPTIIGLGSTCLALAAIYAGLAAWLRRPLKIRSWIWEMPRFRLVLAQVVIGPINFAFVAACLYQAIAAVADVDYFGVASVYVIANVTALGSHVPGGLGIIESVVTFMVPYANLIGALVVFRFIYFWLPLMLGGALFVVAEITLRPFRTQKLNV